MYLKIYKKLEYENMSSNFYECLVPGVEGVKVSRIGPEQES